MTAQNPLFKTEPATLTAKQQRALDVLKAAGKDGMTGSQLGFHLHGHDRHACDFCQSAGLGYLRILKRKGHARLTKGGVYIALDLPDEKPDAQRDLPEGF